MSDQPQEVPTHLEERARRLLVAAAETVDVDLAPAPPSRPARRRPRWPLVAAATTVVAVVGLTAVLVELHSPETVEPAPASSVVTVPQTLMMTTQQASETLEGLGLAVVIRSSGPNECGLPDGRVLRSRPAATSVVSPGTTVRIDVVGGPRAHDGDGLDCVGPERFQDALALLDLARFGVGGPRFAPTVQVWVDGEFTTTLSAQEAADPLAWGNPSPLTRLTAAVNDVLRQGDRLESPTIWSLVDQGDQYRCGPADPPPALAHRPSTVITVAHQVGGDFIQPGCHWVRVYRDSQDRVDAVSSIDRPWPAGEPPDEPAAPTPAEPTAQQRAVAESFAAFARGGPPPAFDTSVQLLLGNEPVRSVTAHQAVNHSTWVLSCNGYAERDCPIDVLAPVAAEARLVTTGTTPRDQSACSVARGNLPFDLTAPVALANSVSLSIAEPDSCIEAWELQLWLNDDGAVRAANLLLGSP